MKLLIAILCAAVSAQPAMELPPVGKILDSGGQLTPVYGIAGNFLTGRPGPVLLAYSNDGEIEWGLESGRLFANRGGQTAVLPVTATRAVFRGDTAILPESNEVLQYSDGALLPISQPQPSRIAGRQITWLDGKLRVVQADGNEAEVDCPDEPSELTAAAADWVHLIVRNRAHLLRVTAGRVEMYALPQRSRP